MVDRLLRKWETARTLVPAPAVDVLRAPPLGIMSVGSCDGAVRRGAGPARRVRRRHQLPARQGVSRSASRLQEFIDAHERVYVVEQNRDAQLRGSAAARDRRRPRDRLIPVLHYDGMPIDGSRASSSTRSRIGEQSAQPRRRQHELHRQTESHASRAAAQRTRADPARLRGRHVDAVRRLRPRLDHGGARAGVSSSWTLRRTAWPRCSGIGCSSKTPAYFARASHGFNSVHGRMAVGGHRRQRGQSATCIYIGVSGDGDSLSIGLGQFCHAMRRNLNMLYIIENNGVYGLTKGQFSASADVGSEGQEGRGEPAAADRSGAAGDRARRYVRGAQLFRRQGAAGAADQGRRSAHEGFALHRRHLALRDLQRSRGLDQELRASRASTIMRRSMPTTCRRRRRSARRRQQARCMTVAMHDGSRVAAAQGRRRLRSDRSRRRLRATCARRQAQGEIVTGLLYHRRDRSPTCTRSRALRQPAAEYGPLRQTESGTKSARLDPVPFPIGSTVCSRWCDPACIAGCMAVLLRGRPMKGFDLHAAGRLRRGGIAAEAAQHRRPGLTMRAWRPPMRTTAGADTGGDYAPVRETTLENGSRRPRQWPGKVARLPVAAGRAPAVAARTDRDPRVVGSERQRA